MPSSKIFRLVLILILLVSNVSCDQITKHIARENLTDYKRIQILSPFVSLIKVENTGAFLSAGESLPEPVKVIILVILPFAALVYGLYYLARKQHLKLMALCGASFIIGGGIGNIYDRILFGSVTDFLHIDFILFETGIFNLADVSIMAGVFMVIWSLREEKFDFTPQTNGQDEQH